MRFFFFFIVYFFPLLVEAKPLNVAVSAESAILINAETGMILYEKKAYETRFPASITKIATALYALEKKGKSLDEVVLVDREALTMADYHFKLANLDKVPAYRLEHDGGNIGLKPGEEISLRDLIYGLMVSSGNDAANVIAQHVSGNITTFMAEVNGFLKTNGVNGTTFLNPHGLHHPAHVTTAYDMAKMTQIALRNPIFREVVKTARYTRSQTNKQPSSQFVQTNRLLRTGAFFYPKAIGVKTGYTSKAGYNLVAAAEKDGRTLIAVLLGASESGFRFKDAIALFEAAFAEKKIVRTLFTKEYDPFTLKISGAKTPLTATVSEDLKIEYFAAEEPTFKTFLQWASVKLPIVKGQKVGEIQLKTPSGTLIKNGFLYAAQDVEKTGFQQWLDFCEQLKRGLVQKQFACAVIVIVCGAGVSIYFLRRGRKKTEKI